MITNQKINIEKKKEVEIKKGKKKEKEIGIKIDIHTTAIPEDIPMSVIGTETEIEIETGIVIETENIAEVKKVQNIKIQNLVTLVLLNIINKGVIQVHLQILTQILRIILNLNQNQILM